MRAARTSGAPEAENRRGSGPALLAARGKVARSRETHSMNHETWSGGSEREKSPGHTPRSETLTVVSPIDVYV